MIDALTIAVAVTALALAAWCGFAAFRDQPTKDWHFIGMALVSVLGLVQLVVAGVQLAGGAAPDKGTALFVSYLLGRPPVSRRPGSCRSRSAPAGVRPPSRRAPWCWRFWKCGCSTSGEAAVPETTATTAADGTTATAPARRSLGTGPGRLLVTLYGIFTVAAPPARSTS